MSAKICVYAICKNEAKHVDRWINSLKEADYIRVLDTGSTDNTIELLEKYKPLVEVHQKIFNPFYFDIARNESMKYIPEDTNICVVSDLDQVFRPGWSDILRQRYEEGYDEIYGPIIDYDENNRPIKQFLSRNVHLYEKDGKQWIWKRHIHEGIYYDGDEADSYKENGKIRFIVDNNFVIEHHQDGTKSRQLYLDLCKEEYEKNPKDPYTVIYYGCEVANRDKHPDEAREIFLKGLKECDFTDYKDIQYQLEINVSREYYDDYNYEKALEYALMPLRDTDIRTRRLYMNIALDYRALGWYKQSTDAAYKALSIRNDNESWLEDRFWFENNSKDVIDFIKFNNTQVNKICVYAICKNESKNIERWVNSVKDADVICITDTGSTDNTVELIEKLQSTHSNIKYRTEYFKDNEFRFDKARNIALDFARTFIDINTNNWIFVSLDLDEFLEQDGISKIRQYWTPGMEDTLELTAKIPDGSMKIDGKVHSSDNWKWKRAVHETISLDGKKESDWIVLSPDEPIYYTHEQDTTKTRDYYNMLKEENIEENDTDSKTLIYLGWESLLHDKIEDAVNYYTKCLKIVTENEADENYNDYQYILQCCIAIVEHSDHSVFTDHCIDTMKDIVDTNKFPDNRRTRDVVAKYFYDVELYRECLNQLKLEAKVSQRPLSWVDHDEYYNDSTLFTKIAKVYRLVYQSSKENDDIANAVSYIDRAIYADDKNKDTFKLAKEIRQEYYDSFIPFATKKHEGPNKICVYAITKNEAKFVNKWVDSMQEADSIVVVDTGSTDNTVELLRARGVTVLQKKYDFWRFDIARNDALLMTPDDCNICVSTDLDEILEPGWAKVLKDHWIEGVYQRANYKYTWSHLPNGEEGRTFCYNKFHSRNWIWLYPVHELLINIFNNNTEEYESYQALQLFNFVHLHHYPDQTKSRSSYLPLLEVRVAAYPNDWYGKIYLAHEYFYKGFYQNSINMFSNIIENYMNHYSIVEQASCYLFLGDDYAALNNKEKAIDSYINATKIDPTYREPYLGLARVYINEEEYDKALETLKSALSISYRHYTWLERDISWTYEIFDLLCLAAYYGGKKVDSIAYAAKALSYEPENERLKNNLKLCVDNTSEQEFA